MLQERRRIHDVEFHLKSKAGLELLASVSAELIEINNVTYTLTILHDITERKRSEDRLRASEAYYRTLTEASPDALVIIDPKGVLEFTTPKAEELFGIPHEETNLGTNILNWVSPEDHDMIKMRIREIAAGRSAPGAREVRLLKNNRTPFWGEISSSTILDDSGKMVGLLISCRDISERKRAEEALQQSETRYRAVLQSANDAIVTAAVDGNVSGWNKGAEMMFGYSYTEIVGQSLVRLMPESFRADHTEGMKRLLSGADPHIVGKTVEVKAVRKDGREFPIELSLAAWEVSEGQFYTAIIRDITDRKRAEESLSQERYLFNTLIDNTPDHIYFKDIRARFIRINKALSNTFGLSDPAEVCGKTDADFFTQEHAQSAFDDEQLIIRTGQPIIGMEEMETWPDGRVTWVSSTKMALHDAGGGIVGTFGISRDITEHKQAEAAIQESELRFRSIWNNSADGMRLTDRDGKILDVNDAFCKLVKMPREELIGKVYSVVYQSKDPTDSVGLYQTRFNKNEILNSVFSSATLRCGDVVDLEVTSSFIEIAGQKKMLLSLFRDITERKRAEEAMRASEEKYRELVVNISDVVFEIDARGSFTYGSPVVRDLLGYEAEELIGKSFIELVHPEDRVAMGKRFAELARGTEQPMEYRLVTKSGEVRWVRTRTKPIMKANVFSGAQGMLIDITERKIAEQELQKERNLLRTLIDAIPDEIAVKDTERRFILVNTGTMKALKRASPDEIIGKRDEDLIPEKLVEYAIWEENAVLAVGGHSRDRVSDKINPETGEIERSLLISKIPLKDNNGRIIGLVGVNRDITELKRAEEMLQKERTLLQTLLESIPDEVCLKDLNHRYVLANAASVKAFGAASPEEIIGKTDREFVPSEYVQLHFDEEDALIASGESMINREQIRFAKDTGEIEKCVLTTKVPVKDKSGKTIGILVVNRDITPRKKAEEGLRASEEKFRALFEESKDCIYVSSSDGKVLDVNFAGVELFGYDSKEELIGKSFSRDLYEDNQRRVEFLSRMNQQGFVKDLETVMKRRDGQKLSVLETAVAVVDNQGRTVMYRGTIRDVTRQKLLERQVGQAQKMESLGLLAGGIAHDFNNILGIILGHTAVVERASNDPDLLKDSIREITTAVQRGASLVRQILTFARKSDAADEPIRVNATVKELAKMIDDTFPKTISVSLGLDRSIPIIMMDQTQLHQALLNLCVNARDAITDLAGGNLGRGEIRIQTSCVKNSEVRKKFSEASASEYVCIAVSDTGKGMDEETKQKIFEPFFTTKERGKGTGLGLSVVYGIIKGHHGHIEVESTIGQGTTFRLYLPVADAMATPTAPPEEGTPSDIRGQETILLVEDEQNLLGLMKMALERAGYTVLTAVDGISAIKIYSLNKEKIALVLTDLGLPKLDGAAVFTSLMDIDPAVKIILASGYLDPNLKSNLLRSGAKEFIQKPYSPNLVLRKIREVLDAAS